MTSTPRRLVLPLLIVLVLASAGAVVNDRDGVDTALGAVAGATSVFLLLHLVLGWYDRRQRRADDLASLDRLEPLRAARRDDT
jgi:hypothetical protein